MGLILSETRLQRLRLISRTPARTGVAIVVQTATGRTEVIAGQLTVGESLFAPHSMQYEVDTAEQRTHVVAKVATREDAFSFQVTVDVVWRVEDPAEVVRRRLDNGSDAISSVVRDRLKELGRQFTIEQTVEFERRLRDEFAGPRSQVGCLRILRLTPDVTLDETGTRQLDAIRKAHEETTIIQARHGNEVLRQRNADEIAEISRKHEMDRERIRREYENETHEMELARRLREAERTRQLAVEDAEFQAKLQHIAAQRQAELAAWEAQTKADLEIQQKRRLAALERDQTDYERANQFEDQRVQGALERERIALFQQAIERGDPDMVAVHLGMHPEDAKEFILAVANDKTATAERQAALLTGLIDRKLIIPAMLDGVAEDLIRSVAGIRDVPEDRPTLTASAEAWVAAADADAEPAAPDKDRDRDKT